ncbi:MAG: hypothetical protein R3F55_07405 [Alphaproteobacteria bacterium]
MRGLGAAIDAAAMAVVGALIWFGWSAVMDYLPIGLADDIDAVIGWFGTAPEGGATRAALRWLGDIEWLIAAVLVVLLLWAAEKLVGWARARLVPAH